MFGKRNILAALALGFGVLGFSVGILATDMMLTGKAIADEGGGPGTNNWSWSQVWNEDDWENQYDYDGDGIPNDFDTDPWGAWGYYYTWEQTMARFGFWLSTGEAPPPGWVGDPPSNGGGGMAP